MINRWFKIISGLFLFSILLFGYTNCGQQFKQAEDIMSGSSASPAGTSLQSTGICDQDLKLLFVQGYHAFLKTNCALCHVNGPGKGRFSSANVDDAFGDFMQTGYSRISDNAVSSSHNPPYSGPQHVQTINDLRVSWQQGLTDFAKCSGQTVQNPTAPLSDFLTLETSQKVIPTIDVNQTATVQWDLTTELNVIKGTDPLPIIPGAQFSIVVGKYKTSGGATYYTFTQPRMSASTVDVQVKTIQANINGFLLNYPTTFKFVNKGIYKNSDIAKVESLITTGSLVAPRVFTAQDKISFAFELIQPTNLPPPKAPVQVNFSSQAMNWVTPSTGFADVTLQLNAPGDLPITVTVSEDASKLCAATTPIVDIKTCNPTLASFICAGGGCPDARNLSLARSIVGTTFNRYDWDFKFATASVTFNVGETSKSLRVIFSGDIRKETNRLFTLQIDAGLVNAQRGAQDKVYFVFNKLANPTPAVGIPTFSELMAPTSGVLGMNCVSCHNSKDINGGYDMTDYASMRSRGVIIPFDVNSMMFSRMNPSSPLFQFSNPMPLNGQLDVPSRKQVEDWILNGAKNN